jgi:DNA-binding MarR family transcriptional regulator
MTASVTNDVALEAATLQLINMVAYAAHARAFTRHFAEVTGVDLPGAELRTLLALTDRPPISTSELAAVLSVDVGQASRQVTTLAEQGLVERSADPADRRRSLLGLSERGAAVELLWRGAWTQKYLQPVLSWTDADVEAITEWLIIVEEALHKGLGSQPPHVDLPRDWHVRAGLADDRLRPYLERMVRLVRLVGQSRGFDDLLEEIQAPINQHAYFALRLIGRRGPMAIAELASVLGVDPSQASKRVRTLEEHKLVDRAVDGFDRRSWRVRASRRGNALIDRIHALQLSMFREALGDLPDAERVRWTGLMQRLLTQLAV